MHGKVLLLTGTMVWASVSACSAPVPPRAPRIAQDSDVNGEEGPHHFAVSLGLGTETRNDHPDEEGSVIGGEYIYRINDQWGVGGVGGVVEGLGHDTIRN
jgi:hypothetical protein